jgi:hypothetical protein
VSAAHLGGEQKGAVKHCPTMTGNPELCRRGGFAGARRLRKRQNSDRRRLDIGRRVGSIGPRYHPFVAKIAGPMVISRNSSFTAGLSMAYSLDY